MSISLRHKKAPGRIVDWLIQYHLEIVNRWIGPSADFVNLHLLAHWNDSSMRGWSPQSRDRVRKIFQMASEMIRIGQDNTKLGTDLLNLMDDYPALPYLGLNRGDPVLFYRSSGYSRPSGEVEAVWSLLLLAQIESLPSLKSCPVCGRLFNPKRKTQKNCSGACSRQAYDKTPKERERRRRASREYYDRNGRGGQRSITVGKRKTK